MSARNYKKTVTAFRVEIRHNTGTTIRHVIARSSIQAARTSLAMVPSTETLRGLTCKPVSQLLRQHLTNPRRRAT